MLIDHHVHTFLCRHATGDPSDYVGHARHIGLQGLSFSDHAPAPDGYDAENRMAMEEFPRYEQAVRCLQGGKPEVLFGIEADYYPGCEAFLAPWLKQTPFDVVLGSVHYIDNWGFDNPENRKVWDSVDVTETWRTYFSLLGELADTRLFDVVAHLDLPKKFGHRPPDTEIAEMAKPTLDRIRAAGMAVEINTSGLRKTVGEMYPSPLLLELAAERDIPLCVGSDAHAPDQVGHAFDRAVALAHGAGYRETVRLRGRRMTRLPLPS